MALEQKQNNDHGSASRSPFVGVVNGTAIFAESVTIQNLYAGGDHAISSDQVLALDNMARAVADADPERTRETVWADLYSALNTAATVPTTKFEEAKEILSKWLEAASHGGGSSKATMKA